MYDLFFDWQNSSDIFFNILDDDFLFQKNLRFSQKIYFLALIPRLENARAHCAAALIYHFPILASTTLTT